MDLDLHARAVRSVARRRRRPRRGASSFERAVTEFGELVRWFRERPAPERRDQRARPGGDLGFGF
jgi:hypothetical protein